MQVKRSFYSDDRQQFWRQIKWPSIQNQKFFSFNTSYQILNVTTHTACKHRDLVQELQTPAVYFMDDAYKCSAERKSQTINQISMRKLLLFIVILAVFVFGRAQQTTTSTSSSSSTQKTETIQTQTLPNGQTTTIVTTVQSTTGSDNGSQAPVTQTTQVVQTTQAPADQTAQIAAQQAIQVAQTAAQQAVQAAPVDQTVQTTVQQVPEQSVQTQAPVQAQAPVVQEIQTTAQQVPEQAAPEQAPVQAAPVQAAPVQETTTQVTPTQATTAQSEVQATPVQETTAQVAPTQSTPAQSEVQVTSVQTAPQAQTQATTQTTTTAQTVEAPVQAAPVQSTPVQTAQAQTTTPAATAAPAQVVTTTTTTTVSSPNGTVEAVATTKNVTVVPIVLTGSDSPQCPSDRKVGVCPLDYTPVCAYLKNGSSMSFGNNCTACANPNVVSFVQGTCSSSKTPAKALVPAPVQPKPQGPQPGAATVQRLVRKDPPPIGSRDFSATSELKPADSSAVTVCQASQLQTRCTFEYRQVCGVHANLTRQTYNSGCFACNNPAVKYYRSGACKQSEITANSVPANLCPNRFTLFCGTLYNPVCSYSIDGTSSTQPSACLACLDKKVFAYRNGDCPPTSSSKTRAQLCGGSGRGQQFLCLLEFREVCVVNQDGKVQDFPDGCAACNPNNSFVSYTVGKCSRRAA